MNAAAVSSLVGASGAGRRSPRLRVLVAHRSPLVAAGLVSTLQRVLACAVSNWASNADPELPQESKADVVFSDINFARSWQGQARNVDAGPRRPPKLVLITSGGEGEASDLAKVADACLSIDCAQDELLAIIGRIGGLPARPRGGLAPGVLRRVREHIESNLGNRIDSDVLAAIAGLSNCHFARAFKQSLGLPPHRYVMERRLEAAAKLIRESNTALAEIAMQVGFCDQSHFTRLFAARMGSTPLEYRRAHR